MGALCELRWSATTHSSLNLPLKALNWMRRRSRRTWGWELQLSINLVQHSVRTSAAREGRPVRNWFARSDASVANLVQVSAVTQE